MAKQIILVTGGARSGKSKYAELRAHRAGRSPALCRHRRSQRRRNGATHRRAQKAARRRLDYYRGSRGIVRGAAGAARPDRLRASGLLDHLAEQSSAAPRCKICGGESRRIGGDIAAAWIFIVVLGHQRGRLGHRAGQCSGAAISRPRRLGQSTNRRGQPTKSFLPLPESR